MEEIRIVDTTLRDGNTSLWAHNMTTGMMHPVLRHMDQAGFDSMEFFVSGRFKKVVREQRDNPWDWVRYGQKEIKNTPPPLPWRTQQRIYSHARLHSAPGDPMRGQLRHHLDAPFRSLERL